MAYTHDESANAGLSGVKHIIAIASGKGGVGKSTVASNLAVALRYAGATVGLMDADIYGPSQPGMLGAKEQAEVEGNHLIPVQKHGIPFISMGSLMGSDGPVIWRAPMAMKVIHQFIGNVQWGNLDFLLIDLPPGTGDVQLTLAQQASLSGAIIVTTPQDVALGIAKKGLKMFQQVNVPILGIIENMSGLTCEHCGKSNKIFKQGGGVRMAEELSVPFLGAIPLDAALMEAGDSGVPILLRSEETDSGKAFLKLAHALIETMNSKEADSAAKIEPKNMGLSPSTGHLQILWPDGHQGVHKPYHLRLSCGCAMCRDEVTGRPLLDPKKISLDIKVKSFGNVGRYAVGLIFSDGHNTGIFPYEKLRALCECDECLKTKHPETQSFSV